MRVFFDSNIWIAAIASAGACDELVVHCRANHTILVSLQVLKEVARALKSKLHFLEINSELMVGLIRRNAMLAEEIIDIPSVCRDPSDNHILAAAKGGSADCIVTGDKDLLVLKHFGKISILAPSEFWAFEAEHAV